MPAGPTARHVGLIPPEGPTHDHLDLANRLGGITEDGRIRWTTFADVDGNEFDPVNTA